MTEYEIAIATLELREAAIWVAVAQAAIALGVGGAQCVLIWRGLYFMRRSAESRDEGLKLQGEADERRHNEAIQADERRHKEAIQADEKRHKEAMKALADRHAATMKAEADRHAEAMQAFERQERESDRRHAAVMAAHAATMEAHAATMEAAERRERESLRRHEETMAALDAQRRGMETLIERTAPAGAQG